ncbi:MAG: secretin and TonB N-terminal domain-containing protein [Halothece sp.]
MNNYPQHLGMLLGTAILLAQPLSQTASAQVRDIKLQATQQGFNLNLATNNNQSPQIFSIKRGNVLVADLTNTQLDLGNKNYLQRNNPFPGVESLTISQNQANSVRIIVKGTNDAPKAKIGSVGNGQVTINFAVERGASQSQTAQQSSPREQTFSQTSKETSNSPSSPSTNQQQGNQPKVKFPNPEITVNGKPAQNGQTAPNSQGVKPTRPRAVAPPVGDIAVSPTPYSPEKVDLGTNMKVPRLVLREAPVREVLSLLARSANLNLVFADQSQGGDSNGKNPAQQTISVDLENESVQQAFNSVLQLSGLDANRRGNTIFVGKQLPKSARDIMTRTLRLNQVSVDKASSFLATQGAEVQQVVTPVEKTFNQETGALVRETEQPSELRPLTVNKPEQATGALLLQGLSVSTDQRLNAITLVGEPRKISTAIDLLKQLDARRRQVSVNVKILDINLNQTENFSSSFSFGINDSFFVSDGGAAALNFGGTVPPQRSSLTPGQPTPPVIPTPIPEGASAEPFFDIQPNAPFSDPGFSGPVNNFPPQSVRPNFGTEENPFQPGVTDVSEDGLEFAVPELFQFPSDFLAQLEAQVTNGNAKVLTDPTLLIKEGQTAGVKLTQEVFAGTELVSQAIPGSDSSRLVEQPIIKEAGLTLDIQVDNIDDNGFVTLNVNPTVSAISGQQQTPVGTITLLNKRQLNSGEIRLRDGQTLIVAGIIQDEQRTTVSKVPILGDLPILGSLFRSTDKENVRREVIVLLTPKILDSSRTADYQGSYEPSPATREMLKQRGYPTPQRRRSPQQRR